MNNLKKIQKEKTQQKLIDINNIIKNNHKCVKCNNITYDKTKNLPVCKDCRLKLKQDVLDLKNVERKIIEHTIKVNNFDDSKLNYISTNFILHLHKTNKFSEALLAYNKMLESEKRVKKNEKK